MGEELYKSKIDEIIQEENLKLRNKKLSKLIEESKHDHYVLARVAQYRFENGQQGYLDLLHELEGDDDYFVFTNYCLGATYARRGQKEKGMEYLEKLFVFDGYYAEKAREMYPGLLFDTEDYENVLGFFEYLKQNNILNDTAYFYAAKVYFHRRKFSTAQEYVEKAVEMNPDVIEYHNFLRALYQDTKQYREALKQVRILQSMDISQALRNKLDLIVPELLFNLEQKSTSMKAIKKNKDRNLTNGKQESLYFQLGVHYGDFKSAEESAKELINTGGVFSLKDYSNLMRMYSVENLCDKSLELYKTLNVDENRDLDIVYSKACILVQMGKYDEAEKILTSLIKKSRKAQYYRLLVLCLYFENKNNEARKILKLIPQDATRLDIFLRNELGILDLSTYKEVPTHAKLVKNYDYGVVYKQIRNRYNDNSKALYFNDGINIGRFMNDIKDIIGGITPNYRMQSSVYLIDYGKDVATVNSTQTGHIIAETLPNGELINLKPVIPTDEGRQNYQRVR